MPVLEHSPRFRGISLPPAGWALAVLLSLYIFTGLSGHDPWKHDDALTIGVAFGMFSGEGWLFPHLAGQPYPDAPLYYWMAAGFARLFAWLLPVHEAVRLASGLCTLLALEFILLAARELYGKDFAASAPLLLAGSIGFLYHAHEAQPMLAVLMAHTAAYWALILLPRRPLLAVPVFGGALGAAFLANGLLPVLTLIPVVLLTLALSEKRATDTLRLLPGIALGIAIAAAWLLPVSLLAPEYAESFVRNELAGLGRPVQAANNLLRYLNMLLWYAWPALPLAVWALWSKRRTLKTPPLLLPNLSFCFTLLILASLVPARSAPTLLLLPPLVLFAVPGLASLRRGAANAFDWFGMMAFSFFAALVWVGWSAMIFGWPERLARQVVRLSPGFVGQFSLVHTGFALLVTFGWFWLILTSPRSPMRSIMHWMSGLTLFWVLLAVLWMPWINYGKSYRSFSAELAAAIPAKANCVANANLPLSILASLDYFAGIRPQPLASDAGRQCHWLLVLGDAYSPAQLAAGGWQAQWDGKRPGDRRSSDTFHLYRRNTKAKTPRALDEIPVEQIEEAGKAIEELGRFTPG